MKVVCISDTHCQLSRMTHEILESDVIVHAGDALNRGTYSELSEFLEDFSKLSHKYKIYVPGNHDRITEVNEELAKSECEKAGIVYLRDEELVIDGIKFYGSPVTPRFHDWAWNRDSDPSLYTYIKPYWDAIPEDTDVLITHGPPQGVMDVSIYDKVHCGCPFLWDRVQEIEPKYHIFGHIHNWHGTEKVGGTTFVNASTCNEQYKPVNKPIVLEI